jgi:opacity protein-like surface antigen
MKKLLLTTALAAGLASPAYAAVNFVQFIGNEDGDELKMFNDIANKNADHFFGSVGANISNKDIKIDGVNVNVDTGAGYANIKPTTGNLTSVTFTPQGKNAFDGFFTRGQLIWTGAKRDKPKDGTFTIKVNGTDTFTYTEKLEADFASDGFDEPLGGLGALISSVTVTAGTGFAFKELKQVDWSSSGVTSGVPEPSTWVMGIIGFGMVGALGWRKRSPRYAIA